MSINSTECSGYTSVLIRALIGYFRWVVDISGTRQGTGKKRFWHPPDFLLEKQVDNSGIYQNDIDTWTSRTLGWVAGLALAMESSCSGEQSLDGEIRA
jgi:hypothetical protein